MASLSMACLDVKFARWFCAGASALPAGLFARRRL